MFKIKYIDVKLMFTRWSWFFNCFFLFRDGLVPGGLVLGGLSLSGSSCFGVRLRVRHFLDAYNIVGVGALREHGSRYTTVVRSEDRPWWSKL